MRQSTTTIMVLTLGFDDVATVRIAPAITPTRIAIAIHWAFLDLLDSIVVYSDLGCLGFGLVLFFPLFLNSKHDDHDYGADVSDACAHKCISIIARLQ